MMSATPPKPPSVRNTVFIVGLGLPEGAAATQEAADALSRCKTVFATDPKDPFINGLCDDVRPQGELGSAARNEAMVKKVLAAARAGDTAFTIYGHPLFYEPITRRLVEECARLKAPHEIISGVSSVDAVLSLVRYPLAAGHGLQVGDVSHFAFAGVDPRQAAVVFKFAMDDSAYGGLLGSLKRSHGPAARVAIVQRRLIPAEKDHVEWLAVGGLSARLKKPLPFFCSLFVPPRNKTAAPVSHK